MVGVVENKRVASTIYIGWDATGTLSKLCTIVVGVRRPVASTCSAVYDFT